MRRLAEPRVVPITEVRDIPEFSNVRNLPEPRIIQQKVAQQSVEVRQEAGPVREVPAPRLEESSGPADPSRFTFFQAKPEPANSVASPASPISPASPQPAELKPIPFNPPATTFQAVPAVRQEPRAPEIRRPPPPPTPTFQAVAAIRPEARAPERRPPPPPSTTFQAQPVIRTEPRVPEVRRPQPIPFQSRTLTPSSPRQTQPVSAGEENFFQVGQLGAGSLFTQQIEIPAEANGGASFSYEAIVG